jgi:type II secretory pathway pseudopilin PulG
MLSLLLQVLLSGFNKQKVPRERRIRSSFSHGFTMAELVIAMGLMGVILLPLLLFSSSWFTRQLIKDRENLAVSYGTSQVLNALTTDLGQASRLLSTSDSTHIYLAYYDPTQQTEVYKGYQLSANGSEQKLERLVYTPSTDTWTARSAFAEEAANFLSVNAGATFSYCAAVTCGVTAAQALSVQLSGWQVSTTSSAGSGKVLSLPTAAMYLAPKLVGEPHLSDTVRALGSFTATSAFGTGATITNTFLSPNDDRLSNVTFPSTGYTTLVSNAGCMQCIYPWQLPQYDGFMNRTFQGRNIDINTGRIFWSDGATTATSSNFYTWLPSTGLSTLITAMPHANKSGQFLLVSDRDGRAMWGDQNNLYTWTSTTGLSTLVTTASRSPGVMALAVDIGSNTFYSAPSLTSGSPLWRWNTTNGLSTLISNGYKPGRGGLIALQNSDQVFFVEQDSFSTNLAHVYTWSVASGLSTILSNVNTAGAFNLIVDGIRTRAYFTDNSDRFYTWANNVLTTILSGRTLAQTARPIALNPNTGRVVIAETNSPGNVYTWTAGGGLATINTTTQTTPMLNSAAYDFIGDIAFFWSYSNPGNVYAWSSGVLTTIASGLVLPGGPSDLHATNFNAMVNPSTGRFYFGENNNPGNFYTWQSGVLTTIVSGLNNPGRGSMGVDPVSGRVYFGERSSSGNFYAWSPTTGLTTLQTGASYPGLNSIFIDSVRGRVFWGSGVDSTGVIVATNALNTWPPISSLKTSFVSGEPIGTGRSIEFLSAQYVSTVQDTASTLYSLNGTTCAVDGYAYNTTDTVYRLNNQIPCSTWNTAPRAMAIDPNSAGFTLLDGSARQIEVYADRTINTTPAAPTQLDISSFTTTPTGLAVSPRTGNYLVVDSALQTGNKIRLFHINTAGTLLNTYTLVTSGLSPSATAESNFKLLYNDVDNTVLLLAPNISTGSGGQAYALSLPFYF